MKKRVLLIVILVVLVAGATSFYFLWWLPTQKEKALTALREQKYILEGEVECITKWRICPKDPFEPSKRTCIWKANVINDSLYTFFVYGCRFALKDADGFEIAADYYPFGTYPGISLYLGLGDTLEAERTILLSHSEALRADHSTTEFRMRKGSSLEELRKKKKGKRSLEEIFKKSYD